MLRKGLAGKSGIILGLFLVILVSGTSFGAGTAKYRTLIKACEKGNLEEVERLLNEGADINAKQGGGMTALMMASFKGHAEVAKVLLAKGADIDSKEAYGATPLMCASGRGNAEIVKVLLAKGADVNAKAKNGFTALKLASRESHAEVVDLLKAHGAKECGFWGFLADFYYTAVSIIMGYPMPDSVRTIE